MKPLLPAVAALCLLFAANAHPSNIEEVKELAQSKEPVLEAEESEPQVRKERCLNCGVDFSIKAPNILSALQAIPAGAQVHTQSSFEECSSAKGCAGIKVKDGKVVEQFGDADAFKQAAAGDAANEFTFHAVEAIPNLFRNGNAPFWWMNENSPFKNTAAGGGNFKEFSKSSSSSFSTNGASSGAGLNAKVDLSGNPFLNGEFSKNSAGFSSQGAEAKPSTFQSSSFESSFSTSNKGDIDLSKNPFLNGGVNKFQGQGFQAQGNIGQQGFGAQGAQGGQAGQTGYGSQSQYSSSSNKFGTGYTGSSPSPFTASTAGSNSNSIQSSQKASEFDFEQQQQTQQNIDEIFQGTGNVVAHEHSGGDLQQTCAGQGYVCVHKAQCNNGVVNTNGAGILQAKTKKQYCNTRTEVCCRIEISTLSGAGGLQGSLGVGSATFNQGSQGSGLFIGANQAGQSGSFGAGSASGQTGQSGSGQNTFGSEQGGAFGTSTSSFESSSFSSKGGFQGAQGAQGAQGTQGAQGSQGNQGSQGSSFGQGSFGATASGQSFGAGASGQGIGVSGSFGTNTGANRGVGVVETSSFESSSTTSRGNAFGNNANGNNNNNAGGKFAGTGFAATASGSNFGTSGSNGNRFGSNNNNFNTNANTNTNNEVTYKTTSQSNFIETDSFSAGSENNGIFRPGANGNGLKPGIPYLPPVDNSNSGTNVVSSTSFPATFPTPRPTYKPYVPPVTSTSAPGYLPPEGEQTINKETRVPGPRNPTYNEGEIILDENRQPNRRPPPPAVPSEIPSGCAAALKCTPIEFCTAEGVISNTTVVLTRDQDAYRVPLTDCKVLESGLIGKCCRDPLYTDPWPTNQLGKWVPGVFGGNDGKYVPDSRGSGSISRPAVTARPPSTGSVYLNNFRSTSPKPAFGPNQVTQGSSTISQGSYAQKGQYEVKGQGQYSQGGQGQYAQGGQGQYTQGGQGQFAQGGQGQFAQGGQGQFGVVGQGQAAQGAQGQLGSQFSTSQQTVSQTQFGQKGQGQIVSQGQGQGVIQGQGQAISQGQGQYAQGGKGQFAQGAQGQFGIQGQGAQGQFSQTTQTQKTYGQTVVQGQGQGISQGSGLGVIKGQGQAVSQGSGSFGSSQGQNVIQGQTIQSQSQGFGSGVRQGSGIAVSQGSGFGVENEYSESVQRVFLQQYSAGGQCGKFNGQKPYGNRNDLEVDFAEIPWQAMVLLQTNRSLLCGGVITRPDVVITSAACVDGLNAKNVLIKGGEWKLGIDDEPLPFQIVQVKNILRHPYYKRGSLQYDAAILVLSENLRFAKNIYPICLPGARDTLDAYYNGAGECIVTGWGKQVLQAHLSGAIMHSMNISLINPGECQAKLSQDYPHLLEQYDQESCACGLPTNPVNNICKVDVGSALACTTGDGHFVLKGVYSWDSGCQLGNQLAAFYKFDLEWYEWAIGLIESAKYAQFGQGTQVSQNRFSSQINSGQYSGVKGGVKGAGSGQFGAQGQYGQAQGQFGEAQKQFGQAQGQFGQAQRQFAQSQGKFEKSQAQAGQGQFGFGQFGSKFSESSEGINFGSQIKAPISNSFSASFSEKKVFQTEPKIITYTTKPEIVTFTTKPEYFTYTTKPKLVTYTTKPQFITYETSGSGTNPQYVAPGVTYNPSFSSVVGQHTHNAQCKCLEGKK